MNKEEYMCARDSLDESVQVVYYEEHAYVGNVSDEQGIIFLFDSSPSSIPFVGFEVITKCLHENSTNVVVYESEKLEKNIDTNDEAIYDEFVHEEYDCVYHIDAYENLFSRFSTQIPSHE